MENADAEDALSAALALALAILLHIALLGALPAKFAWTTPPEKSQTALEILPPKIRGKTPEFVEANPYANDIKPKNPAPESFKNQQAADELPDKNSKSQRPFVKGEDSRYKKIVSGTNNTDDKLAPANVMDVLQRELAPQTSDYDAAATGKSSTPAAPQQQQQAQNAAADTSARRQQSQNAAQTPAAPNTATTQNAAQNTAEEKTQKTQNQQAQKDQTDAREKSRTKSAESNTPKAPITDNFNDIAQPDEIDKALDDDTPAFIVPKRRKSDANTTTRPAEKISYHSPAQAESSAAGAQSAQQTQTQAQSPVPPVNPDIPAPRKRPRLSMRIPAGPLMDSNRAPSKAGIVAIDSRFSEFGAYQQRMIEAISRQWNLLGSKYDLSSAYGSQVVVEFWLDTNGELSNFNVLFSTSTQTGSGLCQQAILSTAPYGVWTQEMVNTLGDQPQRVRINFLYR